MFKYYVLHPDDTTIGRDRITKSFNRRKILGRWDSLYNNEKSKRFSNNRVYIDTSIKPNYADADEFDDSPTSDADRTGMYMFFFFEEIQHDQDIRGNGCVRLLHDLDRNFR